MHVHFTQSFEWRKCPKRCISFHLVTNSRLSRLRKPKRCLFEFCYISVMNVTGFRVACNVVEGLLQSNLECLFDAICVQSMSSDGLNMTVTNGYLLLPSETKFASNTTIDTLMSELFLESWPLTSSFPNYYEKCAPILCTSTFTQTGSVLFVLTTLFGLFGGLTIVLRFGIFNLVQWWIKRSTGSNQHLTS